MSMSGTESAVRRPGRVVVACAVSGVLVLVLAGLGYWMQERSRTKVVRAGEVIALIDGWHLWPPNHDDVSHIGTLILVGGRCIGYRTPDSSEQYLIVWPRGAKITQHGSDVQIRVEGHRFKLGDPIDFGIEADKSGADLDLPQSCSRLRLHTVYHPLPQP